jgi:DNA-binding response OmpR family regulator
MGLVNMAAAKDCQPSTHLALKVLALGPLMKSKPSPARSKRLLVAEDDERVGGIVCEALQLAGFKTHWVKDGIEALNYILQSRPDGIVLDLVLPRLNGFEICGMVRKSQAVQWTPIIIISGRTEHSDKMQGFELGADDYVSKPFRIDELIARVEAVLHRNAERSYPTPFASSYSN